MGGDRGLYTATFVLAMNPDSYNRLPDDLKAIIDETTGDGLAAKMGAVMDAADKKGLEVATAAGNNIVVLSDEETARWKAASAGMVDGWVAEMGQRGADGNALIEQAKALIAKYEGE